MNRAAIREEKEKYEKEFYMNPHMRLVSYLMFIVQAINVGFERRLFENL